MLEFLHEAIVRAMPLLVAWYDCNGQQWMTDFQNAVPRAKGPLDFLFKE